MNIRRVALLALATALIGGCQSRLASNPAPVIPTLQYRTNSVNEPGHVSACAGGQPGMHYNCPEDRN